MRKGRGRAAVAWGLGGLAVALFATGLVVARSATPSLASVETASHASDAAPADAEPTSAPVLPASAPRPAGRDDASDRGLRAPVVERFLALTRHPPDSRPLGPDAIDLLEPDRRYERRHPLPADDDDALWEVHYTADRYALRGGDTAALVLSLWRTGEPVTPEGVVLEASRVGAAGERVRIEAVPDGPRVRAVFTPQRHWPDHVGPVHVVARFAAPGLGAKEGALPFYFTAEARLPGRFTGRVGDRLDGGDLVVDVGLAIDTPGTYRVEGNLHDRHGAPVAWARFEGDLAPGRQSVPLRYHGLLFHDAQARPPFTLTTLRGHRMRRGDAPDREDLRPGASTAWPLRDRYALADFDRGEHRSARKTRLLEHYEEAIARGVRFTE